MPMQMQTGHAPTNQQKWVGLPGVRKPCSEQGLAPESTVTSGMAQPPHLAQLSEEPESTLLAVVLVHLLDPSPQPGHVPATTAGTDSLGTAHERPDDHRELWEEGQMGMSPVT